VAPSAHAASHHWRRIPMFPLKICHISPNLSPMPEDVLRIIPSFLELHGGKKKMIHQKSQYDGQTCEATTPSLRGGCPLLQECIFSGTQGLKALRRAWKTDESWEAQKKNASFSSLTPSWVAFRFHENSVIDPRGSITLFNDRNRRVSSPLSPIFSLFLVPAGILYQKVQRLLAEEETAEENHPL